MWQGSFLTGPEVEHDLRVAVLGSATADTLGLGAEAVGSEITIGGIPFQVVGILQPKGGSGFLNQDDKVLIPVGAVQRPLRRRRLGALHRRQRRARGSDRPSSRR